MHELRFFAQTLFDLVFLSLSGKLEGNLREMQRCSLLLPRKIIRWESPNKAKWNKALLRFSAQSCAQRNRVKLDIDRFPDWAMPSRSLEISCPWPASPGRQPIFVDFLKQHPPPKKNIYIKISNKYMGGIIWAHLNLTILILGWHVRETACGDTCTHYTTTTNFIMTLHHVSCRIIFSGSC